MEKYMVVDNSTDIKFGETVGKYKIGDTLRFFSGHYEVVTIDEDKQIYYVEEV